MLYGVRQLQPRARALHDHDDWNTEVRGETPMQRADRAYGEILQEVRVAQTGVQLLFAFLLEAADRIHERDTGRERSGPKVRTRPAEQHAPVVDAEGLMELPRGAPFGHARNVHR